ncbi:MAG: heavy-metal-associated domain-containing protein [Clostridia bacterium]|nr:heavy-metal-associated domain-containing protein [Clostridia bacterium]
MTCNHCRMSVEEALRGIAGVQSADVSLEKGEARVVYDPARTGLDAMRAAVQEAGYEVAGTASA